MDQHSYFYSTEIKEQPNSSPTHDYPASRGYDSGYPSPNYPAAVTQSGPLAPIQLSHNHYYSQQSHWKGSPIYPTSVPCSQPYYMSATM
uniref:Uncharacterized protein n=1 Tax=Panagrolaimus sp. JU765 TaxID=591449 RepID=A0AC34QI72_9BILA